jgi:hypothetical protein
MKLLIEICVGLRLHRKSFALRAGVNPYYYRLSNSIGWFNVEPDTENPFTKKWGCLA